MGMLTKKGSAGEMECLGIYFIQFPAYVLNTETGSHQDSSNSLMRNKLDITDTERNTIIMLPSF